MNGSEKIQVNKLHSDEMVCDELKAMLGVGKVHLTLGALASLAILKSPYLYGGKVGEEQLVEAYELVKHDDNLEPIEFHEELQKEIDTAWRAFEILVPDNEMKPQKTSEIETFSPEWFADVISQACQSMPSLTYGQILHQIPLTMILHLAVSTARRNGTLTVRPNDVHEALRQFREKRSKE